MQTDDPKSSPRPFHARSGKDLGVAIKYFRTLAGMSQAELAARAGVHRSYLAALENGHSTEALERIMTLLKELNARVNIMPEE